jgi:hypothetical protein
MGPLPVAGVMRPRATTRSSSSMGPTGMAQLMNRDTVHHARKA